ncbi:MAG: Rsd/AlgQ family anti-sigma factor [Gammaproteobacteria bacterium]|nr:Rsd/AlgQ family anti-sigma factor [Gammaproteobacteria bacterium]
MSESQIHTIKEIAQKISQEDDRRNRLSHTINELLDERQEVLVVLCELAKLELDAAPLKKILLTLKGFNQMLVDYTALGHFEIYQRIMEGNERRESILAIANDIYPVISSTTDYFVEFNDKYEGADDQESIFALAKDLSMVGEAMASRIEKEDKLLREMSNQVLRRNN